MQKSAEQSSITKQEDIRAGYKQHAALAQYYRWFQVYERPTGGLDNALDILSSAVRVTSGLGTASGHDDYAARVKSLPNEWQNAHYVTKANIHINDDNMAVLKADITYQNRGVLPEGKVREAGLSYTLKLTPSANLLPKISNVTIEQNSEKEVQNFEDAYAENRSKSLVHYWLAIIESPDREASLAKEILADDFSLNFSSGRISHFDGFAEWLAGPGSQVEASTHKIENFKVVETSQNEYQLSMDFDWYGLLPNGVLMQARTKHNWRVQNNVTERFARIKSVDVEVLVPFRVVEP